jgi:hypothetical protein
LVSGCVRKRAIKFESATLIIIHYKKARIGKGSGSRRPIPILARVSGARAFGTIPVPLGSLVKKEAGPEARATALDFGALKWCC